MFFFCIDLPGRFGESCRAITVRLVERALGPTSEISADIFEQFLGPAIGAELPYIVVSSQQISGPLWTALAEAKKPFLLAFDHPHHALENLVVRHGVAFLEAARIVAKSCASVASCAGLPGALALDAERDSADLATMAAAIARHFGLTLDAAGIAEVVAGLANPAPHHDPQQHRAWWEALEEGQRAVVAGAIDPYLARLAGGDLGPIVWERDLFHMNEEPPTEPAPPASRPIDITGRPRYLLYGPYITLPPGAWSATIALGFSAEAAELSYRIEAWGETTGSILSAVTLQPGQQRVVEITLTFAIAMPEVIDIRISNERAAFDGRLALGHVVLTSAGMIRPETRSYLESALGG